MPACFYADYIVFCVMCHQGVRTVLGMLEDPRYNQVIFHRPLELLHDL